VILLSFQLEALQDTADLLTTSWQTFS